MAEPRDEFHHCPERLSAFNERVLAGDLSKVECTNIACVVTEPYLLDLLVFFESVRSTWRFYPWQVFAYSPEGSTVKRIEDLRLDGLNGRYLSPGGSPSAWATNAALKVRLVEHSGLDHAIVSDLDNLFVAETPEIPLLLREHDFVFIGAPHSEWIIQTSFWGFRRNGASIAFARRWAEESEGRRHSDASGLPFALSGHRDPELKVKVLAKPKRVGARHHECPYDIQANIRPISLQRDEPGFVEPEMGRARLLHFGSLRCDGNTSVADRMRVLAERFPESAEAFPYYLDCANRAGKTLGLPTVDHPDRFLSDLMPRLGLMRFPSGSVNQLFHASRDTLLPWGDALMSAVSSNLATSVQWVGGTLQVVAGDTDPQMLLPSIGGHGKTPLLVMIEITPPAPTSLQIFFRGAGQERFHERRSIKVELSAGRGLYYLSLPSSTQGRIRLDPGMVAGRYVIHRLEVRPAPAKS